MTLPNSFGHDFFKDSHLLNAEAPGRIVLAPMEGVVDWVIRDLLTALGGIDLCVTEFIRVTDRLLPASAFYKDCPELIVEASQDPTLRGRTRAGVPVLLQLLGGQPGPMGENAQRAVELGALGIDLNFGCPAKTVNRHDGGAALLKDPSRIFAVIAEVRRQVPAAIPVSAKVRLGFSDKAQHLEIAEAAQSAGASWLTVHARTRDEGYRPPAHWDYIARMREQVKIPVIANGEIWSEEDFQLCRKTSGCAHVMMGRGLMAAPDLARRLKKVAPPLSPTELVLLVRRFAEMSRDFRHELYAVCRLKQWLKNLSRHSLQLAEVFESIKRLENLAPMLAHLDELTAHYGRA
jgi:tRNA-dihydrouridine synthase C